jgi:hypothetical protein
VKDEYKKKDRNKEWQMERKKERQTDEETYKYIDQTDM